MKLAILWENCGPYHVSRFREFQKLCPDAWLVEVADRTRTYGWDRPCFEGVPIHTLVPGDVAESVSALRIYRTLLRFLGRERIDVLFVPGYWPLSMFAAMLAGRRAGCRVVLMTDSHLASGLNSSLTVMVKRLMLRLYDGAFVAGSMQRSFLRHLGIPAERIFDGYDTVDNAHFEAGAREARATEPATRERYNLPEKYILSLGRLVAKKNLAVLIHAYAQARESALAGHHLVFVGSGPEKERLKVLASGEGLPVLDHSGGGCEQIPFDKPAVHFYPFVQIGDLPAFYALATCFVLPSQTEEWGLVVNEAMASGCPVVVSRTVGSSYDLVEPNVTGYRFLPDNAHELAWCLDRICSDVPQAREMGSRALHKIGEWSNLRFARNALAAAKCAFDGVVAESPVTTPDARIWFLQTCIPDYRMPVFEELNRVLGWQFHLFTGTSYFTPDVKTATDYLDWHSLVGNHFLLNRHMLWQHGAPAAMLTADVVVMEMNPRILSTWVILIARHFWNAPTLLWGHAWGRDQRRGVRNIPRLVMMQLATGIVTYTRKERAEMAKIFGSKLVGVAPNSLVRMRDCNPAMSDPSNVHGVLFVGRLNASKKPKLLLQGFAKADLPPETMLYFVGAGDERLGLEKAAAAAGLRERVRFLGHVQNVEVLRKLYGTAFCAVSPGYVGLAAIQAFSFGIPLVLAGDEPHAPEVEACVEGFNTSRFTANDPEALARALEKYWARRDHYYARREELAAWTARYYSIETMAAGFVSAITASLGGPAGEIPSPPSYTAPVPL